MNLILKLQNLKKVILIYVNLIKYEKYNVQKKRKSIKFIYVLTIYVVYFKNLYHSKFKI